MNVNAILKALDALLRGTMRIASLMRPEGTEMSNPNSVEAGLQRLVNGEDLLDVLEEPLVEESDRLTPEGENHATKRTSRASSP